MVPSSSERSAPSTVITRKGELTLEGAHVPGTDVTSGQLDVEGYRHAIEIFFIAQEILGLEKRGVPQLIVSLRQPTEGQVHDMHREIAAQVLYLPEYLLLEPLPEGDSYLGFIFARAPRAARVDAALREAHRRLAQLTR